ncbi:MAG: DUF2264 domain-containing protein, partial [Trueperaceae bacterium]
MNSQRKVYISFQDNPLQAREDFQEAVCQLFAPLKSYLEQGHSQIVIGSSGTQFEPGATQLEGFARPLWGVIPLLAGGGAFEDWPLFQAGLKVGSDPTSDYFWGNPVSLDARYVEMAALAFALLLAPEQTWHGLAKTEQQQFQDWLLHINTGPVSDNNWLFFRVLVNLALHRVGARCDFENMYVSLDRLEQFDLGGGWYSDGTGNPSLEQIDHYIAFAMHFYGLLYSVYAKDLDPERCERFRQRATAFAKDYVYWFADDGSGLPFGRSLIYRFAQGAFWGAFAFAGLEPEEAGLSWGDIRGLWARHLRYWSKQSMLARDGILTIGYAYENLFVSEEYNSPQSPYWAMKFFLPLALDNTHPFWQAHETFPTLNSVKAQAQPGMVLCRDGSHTYALSARQYSLYFRQSAEKYAKFAYSTHFGFSVSSGRYGLGQGGFDSTLAFSEDGKHFVPREKPLAWKLEENILWSRWSPLQELEVETWLVPLGSWHLRLHRIFTNRRVLSAEGAWAVDRTGDHLLQDHRIRTGEALAIYKAGASGIKDVLGKREGLGIREGLVVRAYPNTNVLAPRTVIPMLTAWLKPGEHWLATAV